MFLIGFMASGKSEVGRALARRLGRAFLDTDALVARTEGRSPARIFRESGEPAFRRLERAAVARAARSAAVVALGGGALLAAANRRALRRGAAVYLQVPFAVLFRRGERARASRPLWAGRTPAQRRRALRRLLAARRPLYRRCAGLVVRGSGSPEAVAERIARRLP